jgi:hypothetical protein
MQWPGACSIIENEGEVVERKGVLHGPTGKQNGRVREECGVFKDGLGGKGSDGKKGCMFAREEGAGGVRGWLRAVVFLLATWPPGQRTRPTCAWSCASATNKGPYLP